MADPKKPADSPSSESAGSGPSKAEDLPSAGPHSEPELTDDVKTPGAGTLPDPGEQDGMDSTSG